MPAPRPRGGPRLAFADQAVGHLVAAGDAEPSPLRGVALAHTLRQLPAVGLGLVGLADELVPAPWVRGEQPFIGEEHDDPRGVEMVLDRDERLLQVAQEAADVADDEDIEGATLGGGDHRLPGRGPPGRGPSRGGHRPLQPGIDEAIAFDGPVLLLALGIGTEVVPLAGRGLAEPSGRPHPGEVVKLSGQRSFHAAVLLSEGQGTVPRPRRSTSRSAATSARTTGCMAGGGGVSLWVAGSPPTMKISHCGMCARARDRASRRPSLRPFPRPASGCMSGCCGTPPARRFPSTDASWDGGTGRLERRLSWRWVHLGTVVSWCATR